MYFARAARTASTVLLGLCLALPASSQTAPDPEPSASVAPPPPLTSQAVPTRPAAQFNAPAVRPDPVPPPQAAASPAAPPPRAAAPAPGAAPQSAYRIPPPDAPSGPPVTAIRITGNQRIEASTISSYMLLRVGQPFSADAQDRSLKALYATGLFSDVQIDRDGTAVVVKVIENPIVNRIAFEGNRKLTDTTLRPELQLKPRSVYTAALAEADRQRILDLYAKRGRFGTTVVPKIIRLDQNRVDVVFEIDDGLPTLISRISFVGNKDYSESTLREVIGAREERWWRFLGTSDVYDPDRLNFDKELLRRFYLHKGYADFEVVSANGELAPDKSGFYLTFTISEGKRYKVSKVDIISNVPNLAADSLRDTIDIDPGDWYDGEAVERLTQELTTEAQNRGFAFAEVKPQVKRDREKGEIEVTFNVGQGPRVYVERIDIEGNVRTMDKVVRREFKLAEGDAFNAALARKTRQRIQDLDYFNDVTISTAPGSTPDKVNLVTNVSEKSTGELTFGGGYSTDIGPLLTAGIRERNLVGTGIDAALTGLIAQKQTQINLGINQPYLLDDNLVAGMDVYQIIDNLQSVAQYDERRTGATFRLGYEFTDHLRQIWSYQIVDRNVYSVQPGASLYVQNAAGNSLLSQIGQTFTVDYRDSKIDPHSGWIVRLGTDFAGLGGNADYIRTKIDAGYYIPLEQYFGDPAWTIAVLGGFGYLNNLGKDELIIDRFFLGGDNLRGFAVGGAGPHAIYNGNNSIGGRLLWTQTTELRFPLPISADIGLTGRTFVDIGGLTQVSQLYQNGQPVPIVDYASPRMGVGVGISWKTPFGLLNIDFAIPVMKRSYDQTQSVRFGFGTRF